MPSYTTLSRSERGARRKEQLDATIADEATGTFIVYAGSGGDTGTHLLIEDIDRLLRHRIVRYLPPMDRDTAVQRAESLIGDVSQLIRDFEGRERYMGIGLSIAIAQVFASEVVVSNVGACRVYFSRGTPLLVSTDHTVLAEHGTSGLASVSQDRVDLLRGVLTRSVSAKYPEWGPAAHAMVARGPGNRLFLCTSHFWEFLRQGDLEVLLGSDPMDVAFSEIFAAVHSRLAETRSYDPRMAGLLVSLGTA